jgi:ferredoxin
MPDALLTVRLGEAAEPGDTLLAALRRAGTPIRSICGGRGACGACRIALEQDWITRLPEPSRNEARLLAVLPGAGTAHRLACQITLGAETDGLAFRLDTPLRRAAAEAQSTTKLETHP